MSESLFGEDINITFSKRSPLTYPRRNLSGESESLLCQVKER